MKALLLVALVFASCTQEVLRVGEVKGAYTVMRSNPREPKCDDMHDTLKAILLERVPEVRTYMKPGKFGRQMVELKIQCTDPDSRDTLRRNYYRLYATYIQHDITFPYNSFLISKDLDRILIKEQEAISPELE